VCQFIERDVQEKQKTRPVDATNSNSINATSNYGSQKVGKSTRTSYTHYN